MPDRAAVSQHYPGVSERDPAQNTLCYLAQIRTNLYLAKRPEGLV
jgi:hypothetical protein